MSFLKNFLRRRASSGASSKMKSEVDKALLHTACRKYASSCLWLLRKLAGPRDDFLAELDIVVDETRPTPLESHDAIQGVTRRIVDEFESAERKGTWLQAEKEQLMHALIDAIQELVKTNNDLGAFDSEWQTHVIHSLRTIDFEGTPWPST